MQEKDSNPRPPGYGPGELPLLYPAVSPGLPGIYANKRGYRSRQPNAFGFMVHYNILETNNVNKSNKLD